MNILLLPYKKKITTAGDVGDISNFTSPIKLFDYLAAGKVILSSKNKILKETLVHNNNCIFIDDSQNPYAWKKVIRRLKNNKKLYTKLSRNSFLLSKKNTYFQRAKLFLDSK